MFQVAAPSPPPPTKKVTVRKESVVQEKLAPPPPQPVQAKQGKKSKKKFARHKIRSESPDNEFKDLDDLAETQVAASESKTRERSMSSKSIPEEGSEAKSKDENKSDVPEEENVEGHEEEDEFSESVSIHVSKYVGPKDTPLERRALLSLEKQLEMEIPESKLDFKVYFLMNTFDFSVNSIVYNSVTFFPLMNHLGGASSFMYQRQPTWCWGMYKKQKAQLKSVIDGTQ